VPDQNGDLAGEEALGELRQVEGRGVAASTPPEAPRDGDHRSTFGCPRCRAITRGKRFGDGA
jgi:hypothetical protein